MRCGEIEAEFAVDDFDRYRLLNGLDDIGITEQHLDEIAAYERGRPGFLPSAR